MRSVDRIAVEGPGPNLLQMMENAGREVAATTREMLGTRWPSSQIVVLAGHGGNGGGGISAARHLANAGGNVTVVVAGRGQPTAATSTQLGIFLLSPGRAGGVELLTDLNADFVIDAVIGYGIAGTPRGPAERLIDWITSQPRPVLSVDVPSGIDATTGVAAGARVVATRTVTLALPKTGLAAPEVGDLWLADIGIPAGIYRDAGIDGVPSDLFEPGFRVRLRPR